MKFIVAILLIAALPVVGQEASTTTSDTSLCTAHSGSFCTVLQSAYHNCKWVGGEGNRHHYQDLAEDYQCDEGRVELNGKWSMTIEYGWVYRTEMGRLAGDPKKATDFDYKEYKWCATPQHWDENQKELCGLTPVKECWDGKPPTFDSTGDWTCTGPEHPDNAQPTQVAPLGINTNVSTGTLVSITTRTCDVSWYRENHLPPPDPVWTEKIDKDGHYVVTFDDCTNTWRCAWAGAVESHNMLQGPVAVTLVCYQTHDLKDERQAKEKSK